MTRTLLIAMSLLGSAVYQAAQPAQVPPPDIDLGDTRGADFDAQAVGTATPVDFDFLVGTWSFQFQQQAEPNKYRPTQTGVWTVQKTHDGHIVEDVWRLGTTTNPTITYRVFNPSRKLWEIQGTKPERGGWDDGIAWSQGNVRYLVQHFNSSATVRPYQVLRHHRDELPLAGGRVERSGQDVDAGHLEDAGLAYRRYRFGCAVKM